MLILTWNISGINNSIKCQRLPDWKKKKAKFKYMLLIGKYVKYKDK